MQNDHHIDATGLICPEPIMLLHQTIRRAKSGERIYIIATDPAFERDVQNFCTHLGHSLVVHTAPNFCVQKK